MKQRGVQHTRQPDREPTPLHYPLVTIRYPLSSKTGAHDRNRTGDLVLTKDVLYRLSYVGRLFKLENPSLGVPDGAGDGNRTHVLSLEG